MKNQICPPKEVVDRLKADVIEPKLIEFAEEIKRALFITMELWIENDGEQIGQFNVGSGEMTISVVVRLRFREAYGERILMFCESLFEKDEALSGCSGFELRAEINSMNEIKWTGYTVRYNRWRWTGWR